MTKLLEGLNPAQRQAVESINGPLLIVAGAGSGKTKVLTLRIANLIEQGVAPSSILALTFTNKAAGEMRERIEKLMGREKASGIWAGTFHSIFVRILRPAAHLIGYTSSFSIYDAEDQLSAVKSVMGLLNISNQIISPQQLRSKISGAKSKFLTWENVKDKAFSQSEEIFAEVYKSYEQYLKDNNAMDFDDLLIKTYKLILHNKDILSNLQNRFKYLLVDEYQDTNRVQYLVINLLAKAHQNICVVGDDAQSIYRWRGADIQNILDFQKDYPYCNVVRLEQNYRSTKNILALADSTIRNNVNQIPKKLWTDNPDGNKVEVLKADDERHEADMIASRIKRAINGDFDLSDIAVLYRTNAQSQILETVFRRNDIDYVVFGGTSFYKRKEVKDTLAYLRLLVNESDNESLIRIVNEPPRGIGNTSFEHVKAYSKRTGNSVYKSFLEATSITGLQARAVKSILKFTELVEKYKAELYEGSIGETIINYIEESGLPEMYKDIGTDESLDRWNNIQQLLTDISSFFRNNRDARLEEYLEQISLITDSDEKKDLKNKVTIMTLHSAKGLEFPIVFLAGLENGLFPLMKADSLPEEEEEERRLFYVGITRAKESLYLSWASSRSRFGETRRQAVSKFLKELDKEYILNPKDIGNTFETHGFEANANSGSSSGQFSAGFNPTKYPKSNNYSSNYGKKTFTSNSNSSSNSQQTVFTFRVGDKVNHSKFGAGTITGLKGEGDSRQATVRFESVGKKSLMLKFAGLTKVN